MRISLVSLFSVLLVFLAGVTSADTFGSGSNQFEIDFVSIDDAGNPSEAISSAPSGESQTSGGVAYGYRMGIYEVSERMINSFNTEHSYVDRVTHNNRADNVGGTTYDISATSISWTEAARFVNWLNTSKGYQAAYSIADGGSMSLWSSSEAWQKGGENLYRHKDAQYFLPSENEWYKAAFYDPDKNSGAGGYWDYATGSDTAPMAVSGGVLSGTAVYSGQPLPADNNNTGGLSPYGTRGQNGNVLEWGETAFDGVNDDVDEPRVLRGGSYNLGSISMMSLYRTDDISRYEVDTLGFRVAAVPEPSSSLLVLLGTASFVINRRRSR